MKSKTQKIILFLALLITIVFLGLFFLGKRTVSFVAESHQQPEQQVVETKTIKQSVESIKILFVGDMMFDRYIRQVSAKRGEDFSFQKIDALLKDNDLVIGNLEGPVTNQQSVSTDSVVGSKDNYIFTFDLKVPEMLARKNIKLVNIGNNHIFNFGNGGVESTRKYLTNSRVGYFGDPENEEGRMKIENIKGKKIALINYNQFVISAMQKTLVDISKAKNAKVDLIVLYTHWGTEFVPEPDDKIRKLAHEFVDGGADLIIGSHPHVTQSKENYKGKMIYYSLGNFIFDQYFSPETQKGLAVQIEIGINKEIQFKEFPVKMDHGGQTLQL